MRAIVAIVISAAAAIWFAWGIDWPELAATLAAVKVGWVLLAAAILSGEFVIRALRWQVLLRPLGTPARFGDLFAATVIGAAANIFFPLRAGEIAKPVVASRRTGHPFMAVVATSVMERVYDLLGMVSILLLMGLVLPTDHGAEGELVSNLKLYGSLLGGIAILLMGVFFALATAERSARAIFARIVSISPPPVRDRFLDLFDGFVAGLANARDRHGLWQAALLSIWLWFDGALAIWCLFQAFGFVLPFGAACFVGVAIALAVVLPQAPGFIGVFHVAMEKTMVLWGQPVMPAKGFAIVFWAVSFLPVAAIGLAALWREGIDMSNLRAGLPNAAARGDAAEGVEVG
jgi:glycosyltransferase 2 family protein